MAKFRQTVSADYTIIVEAEDMYEADEIIRNMSDQDFLAKARIREIHQWSTDEFPQEV